MSGPSGASANAISTFIAYTLMGAKTSPTWAVPNYEQIICSCDYVTRSIAVEGMSRCDCLPATHMILQRGPTGTLLVMDGGPEFCSYMMHSDDGIAQHGSAIPAGTLSSTPGSLCVVPFSSCAVIGLHTYVCNNSSGVLTVTWLKRSAYITITVYGSVGSCPGQDVDLRTENFSPGLTRHLAPEETAFENLRDGATANETGERISITPESTEAIDLLAEVIREAELDGVVDAYEAASARGALDPVTCGYELPAVHIPQCGSVSGDPPVNEQLISFDSQCFEPAAVYHNDGDAEGFGVPPENEGELASSETLACEEDTTPRESRMGADG